MALFKCFWSLQSPRLFFFRAKSYLASPVATRYEAIIRGEQEVPEHFNFASDVVDKWIQLEKGGKRPQNPAFWWVNNQKEEVKWSFEELGILSQKAANVLTGPCGLQRGDRIMTVLPRIPEWWILIMACIRTGIVFIPGISQLTAKDISYRLQVSKAKCIVVSEASAPAVESITSECKFLQNKILVSESSRDGWLNFKELLQAAPVDHTCVKTKSLEPMAIYFTSGTTGTPKMVEQSHSSYAIGLTTTGRRCMALNPSAIMWNTSDTGWTKTSWTSVFAPWMHGSCVFVHHLPQFEPTVVLNTLASYPINIFCTPPTGFRMLIQHDLTSYKFMSLEHCVTGGEPLNPEVFEQWKTQTGLDICEGYGQTETVGICTNVLGMKIKPGSMGKPSPPYDVQIVDDQGNILPPGEEGDIGIRIKPKRPFCLFSKYIDNPEKTAASERGDFYVTGDRGTKDKEGYFWFVGRSDDVINSAGYRIGPFEVESALLEHPAVVESAVVSSPDPVRGEVVKAFVILSPAFLSHDPEKLTKELQDHVKKVTAPYKYPRKVEFVQDLPKTVVGKIQRNILRNREWGSGQHGAFLLVSDTPSSSSRFGPERLRKDVGTWEKIARTRLKSIRTSEEAVPPEVFSRSYQSSSLTTTSCRVPRCKTAGWLQKDGHGTEISEAFLTNTEARSNFSAMKTLLKLQILKSFWIPGQPQRSFHRHHRVLSSPIFAQYEAVCHGEQQLPEYFNFASDVVDKWSQMEKDGKRASNPALWWINGRGGEVRWNFEELGILSKKVANILSDRCGLRRGDRIMVILPRIPEWWLLTVACIRTGIILIPGISQLRAKDIEYRLQASKAKCIITTDALAPEVDSIADGCRFLQTKMMVSSEEGKRDEWLSFNELFKEAPADHTCAKTKLQDPMMIYFTSGTTGPPKMAELSQGSFGFRSILNKRCWLDLTPSDVMWCTVDTGWVVAALGSVFDPWILGTCVFVHNLPQAEPTTIPNTLSRFPITTFLAVPTTFRMVVKTDLASYKFMSLKYCMSGGEPVNPEVMEQWKKKTGLDIHEVYGQSETGPICCVHKGMKVIPGSMGKACPPYDVQIIDEETNILPPGQEGAIAIRVKPQRPLGLFSRYVDNPEKTAAVERGDFYVTGDRGVMDKEGYIWFIGREDDIINSSGYRIGPFDVENALIEHPAVAEVAAVSSPDPLRKEVVKAFVVLSPDYTLKNKEILTLELQEHVKKVTAPYKYPRKVEFVQELPKTATGKIKRNELRDREWGRI